MSKPVATASQLRAHSIYIDVPGTELVLQCRRPDPISLLASDLLPLDLFAAVIEKTRTTDIVAWSTAAIADPATYGSFIDRWTCAAVVSPRVVLTRAQAEADAEAIWVEDLLPDLRVAVFRRTSDRLASEEVGAALLAFRAGQSAGTAAGPSGQAVPDAPVAAAADA